MTDQPARLTPAHISALQTIVTGERNRAQDNGKILINVGTVEQLLAAASRDAAPDPRDELIERLQKEADLYARRAHTAMDKSAEQSALIKRLVEAARDCEPPLLAAVAHGGGAEVSAAYSSAYTKLVMAMEAARAAGYGRDKTEGE